MDTLKRLTACLALFWAVPAAAQGHPAWQAFVTEASRRFDVPEAWIWRVMAVESGGRTRLAGHPIRSPKGAIGLMQLMPATWRAMRTAYALGPDPDDPRDNILAGAAYLRLMYDRFGYPGLFAAYNAGPARFAAYLAGGSLPAETQAYLARTTGRGRAAVAAPAAAAGPVSGRSIFAIKRD